MDVEEIKKEVNKLSKEDVGLIAEFAEELYDTL